MNPLERLVADTRRRRCDGYTHTDQPNGPESLTVQYDPTRQRWRTWRNGAEVQQ